MADKFNAKPRILNNLVQDAASNHIASRRGNFLAGKLLLVAGTKHISVPGLTTEAKIVVSVVVPGGTLGSQYECVPTTDGFDVTSLILAGTIQALDTSVLAYICIT